MSQAYGVFFGGRDLDREGQRYTYVLVRHDGKCRIKHRIGSETHTMVDWTAHCAVKVPEGNGEATNDVTVRVGSDSVAFHAARSRTSTGRRAPDQSQPGCARGQARGRKALVSRARDDVSAVLFTRNNAPQFSRSRDGSRPFLEHRCRTLQRS